jgi:hypothetical protein
LKGGHDQQEAGKYCNPEIAAAEHPARQAISRGIGLGLTYFFKRAKSSLAASYDASASAFSTITPL